MTSERRLTSLSALIARGLVIFICCFAYDANAQSLRTSSWSSAPPNVASVSWTAGQIGTFIDSITSAVVPTNVGDFRFADLAADGNLELIAAVDYSGRGFYNRVVVVHKTSVGFAVQEVDASSAVSLSGSLVDINGDGRRELLVPISLTGYTNSSFPVDTWSAVYTWSKQVLVDSTSSYSAYEISLLSNLQSAAASLHRSAPGTMRAIVAQAIYDKVQRLSGVDPTAGLDDASGWAASNVREIRIVAAATLADIGTPAAQKVLAPLLVDSDSTVKIYANAAVKQAQIRNAARAYIEIQPSQANTIYTNSSMPITVKIRSSAGFVDPAAIDLRSITFGETGSENSRIACNGLDEHDHDDDDDTHDRDHSRIKCRFSVSAAGLSVGDSVGILLATTKDGRAVRGVGPIVVISK